MKFIPTLTDFTAIVRTYFCFTSTSKYHSFDTPKIMKYVHSYVFVPDGYLMKYDGE